MLSQDAAGGGCEVIWVVMSNGAPQTMLNQDAEGVREIRGEVIWVVISDSSQKFAFFSRVEGQSFSRLDSAETFLYLFRADDFIWHNQTISYSTPVLLTPTASL